MSEFRSANPGNKASIPAKPYGLKNADLGSPRRLVTEVIRRVCCPGAQAASRDEAVAANSIYFRKIFVTITLQLYRENRSRYVLDIT